jgi:aminobenzoyl-glutamate utilization protein B
MENTAITFLNTHENRLIELATLIWEKPEIALEESYASGLISGQLEKAGFSITKNIGRMPTAFKASWGNGKPIIGILGEYDALPGLSQKVSSIRQAIAEGAPGHGCGHNLFGVASLGAVLAVKETMIHHHIPGTIEYFGCPAEETLVGKVYMARDHAFHHLDAAITWHPGALNSVWDFSLNALNSFKVNFHGIAAHAGGSPQSGRSALDGVQLMDIGVNYLREHIIQEARIHCVITDGGQAPNIVPPYAQIWYYVRAPKRKQVEDIYAWMLDIAKGAALMTQTTYDIEFLTGCHDMIPNDTIGQVMFEKMKAIGGLRFTEDERAFGRKLQESLPAGMVDQVIHRTGLTPEEIGAPFCEPVLERRERGRIRSVGGSTDVGDVSHIVPTAQFSTCCHALGSPSHSWQTVAASGSSIGFKGMLLAAKTLALTALELVTNPVRLAAALKEFKEKTKGKPYVSPLPKDAIPA